MDLGCPVRRSWLDHDVDTGSPRDRDQLRRCHRHYEVDVWANTSAAHFVSDYVEVGGFRLPTERRVHPRGSDGTLRYDFDTVSMDMSDYEFR